MLCTITNSCSFQSYYLLIVLFKQIVNKIYVKKKKIYALKRIRSLTDERVTLMAYHALFDSLIRFGIVAWGMGNQKDLENILICQKKAIRIINKLNNREHCKPFFKKNKILTLISLYIYETILLTKKVPVKTRETFHDHNLRNKNNLNLKQHHLQKTNKTPIYMGSKLYNLLPQNIKSIKTVTLFEKTLKQYLVDRPYYSIQEFYDEHTFTNHRDIDIFT